MTKAPFVTGNVVTVPSVNFTVPGMPTEYVTGTVMGVVPAGRLFDVSVMFTPAGTDYDIVSVFRVGPRGGGPLRLASFA